jgi:phage-related protein
MPRVSTIPSAQIQDAHKLTADGKLALFELVPNDGSGTVRFKEDKTLSWRGFEYTGIPLTFTGEKKSAQTGTGQPTLTIGDQQVDLSPFKPFVYDGYLDGAEVVKYDVLLDDALNNRAVFTRTFYRVRRVPSYGRLQIVLQLATVSDSLGFTMPARQYYPPAFPTVQI